jgi:hypothetical protein
MIAFATTTAFRFVRRLATGQGSAAMYLLIFNEDAQASVEADLRAEFEVQMGRRMKIGRVSRTHDVQEALDSPASEQVRVLRIDRLSSRVVAMLDTHVVRLERAGAQFVFLATQELAERLLTRAPNLRNRLTEVLRIVPENASVGGAH